MQEFDDFVRYHGGEITDEPPFRRYRVGRARGRLLWLRGTTSLPAHPLERGDCVLAETALPAQTRQQLRQRRVDWLDLGGRTRSPAGSALTEELALYLGRYGVRLVREP